GLRFPPCASRALPAACRPTRLSLVAGNAHSLAGFSANRFLLNPRHFCCERPDLGWYARRVAGSFPSAAPLFSFCGCLPSRISLGLLLHPGFSSSSPSVRSHPRPPPGGRCDAALEAAVFARCKRVLIAVHFLHPSNFGNRKN